MKIQFQGSASKTSRFLIQDYMFIHWRIKVLEQSERSL
jgi:hypothetical protein